jgi:RimJ/RimL family protein N-acetyltransferase
MMRPEVQLDELGDDALMQLTAHALFDTDIYEVMPAEPGPMTWTPQRLQEFILFHQGRRGGLDGLAREISLAILVDGLASGVARLQQVAPDSLEVGMWLTRSTRGRGIGGQVLEKLVSKAAELGAKKLIANTTASNPAALAVLARLGADIHAPTPDERVSAEIDLTDRSIKRALNGRCHQPWFFG